MHIKVISHAHSMCVQCQAFLAGLLKRVGRGLWLLAAGLKREMCNGLQLSGSAGLGAKGHCESSVALARPAGSVWPGRGLAWLHVRGDTQDVH